MAAKNKFVVVRLYPATRKALSVLAEKRGQTVSALVRSIIMAELQNERR
jgi:predicted DNA-binding protein